MDPLSLDFAELSRQVRAWRWPDYRANQIFSALHRHQTRDWDEVSTLGRSERAQLTTTLPLCWPEVERRHLATDGTVRYLLRLRDGESVEAVYLPEETFDPSPTPGARVHVRRHRNTLCLSTQVGCAVNCRFCLTALLGLKRNLDAGEIVAEALTLMREHRLRLGEGAADRVNIVYMGMGEPFLNYEAVMKSVRILTSSQGTRLAPRRITVSTAGIVEKIARFGCEPNRPRLAISLNAASDSLRQELMPLNRGQGGIEALLAAARAFPLDRGERLTFEYVLLAGVNDAAADARQLAECVRGLRCKINLIAWNHGPELAFQAPAPERVREFQQRLAASGVPAFVRRPRGQEIFAACGQLSRRASG